MSVTTEEAERLAKAYGGFWGLNDVAQALRSLAAERDALQARVTELERHFRETAAGTPLGHEDHQRGASTLNWLIYCATTISAIKDRQP